MESLEPVSNDANKLRQMGKPVNVNAYFLFHTKKKQYTYKFRIFSMKFFLVHNQLNI